MKTKNTFYNWLIQQLDRDDPIGDLANDVKRDSPIPLNYQTLEAWVNHLIVKRACSEALETLREAWSEYSGESLSDTSE